ncbi:MAG: mechanosensitive ion channel [Caulobacter sp.]|nr:mechanosensitive ion channel [Caulobacter sp.]
MAVIDPSKIPNVLPKVQTQAGELATASLLDKGAQLGLSLIVAIAILAFTFWIAKWASKAAHNAMARIQAKNHGDVALQAFVSSIVRYVIIIIGLIAVLQQLGIKTTSILAVLGAASLAVGLAMQGALSNVAAGVMLLILRPYRAGELVEVNGQKGKVQALDLFTTELVTLDGLKVIMPNGKVFGEMITNYSAPRTRRSEVVVGIDYDDDIGEALEIMLGVANADPRVLQDPEPWARCTGYADSSVTLTLRTWAKQADYWNVHYDLHKAIKEAFDDAGISIPYPHQVEVPKPPKRKRAISRKTAALDDPGGPDESASAEQSGPASE